VNFLAEACFSRELFGPDQHRDELFEERLERSDHRERAWLEQVDGAVAPFVRWCLEAVDWRQYRIVGFSTTFIGQTLPSLLLAARLKAAHPHLEIVLGGSNTEGDMGVELLRQFPQVDFVLRGECDESFPELCRRILSGDSLGAIPGLVQRSPTTGALEAAPPALVKDMDALAPPDFDDWLEQALNTSFGERYRRKLELPFESSRGCWWGEVSHCLFCGINGDSMAFRGKSPARMRAELDLLVEKYRPTLLMAADSILDHRYYATLLQDLAEKPIGVALSYEIKANVTRRHVEALSAANVVDVVPGIEALSTRLLGLIGKGATAISNLLCLRLAAEHGIHVTWYHLCGLPSEELEDYQKEAELIGRIHHLPPPREIARFTLQRFSPYWREPAKHKIAEVRALRFYRAVFPFDREVVDNLAYNFDFRFGDGRAADATASIEALVEGAMFAWQADYGHVRLDAMPLGDHLMLVDTRRQPPTVYLLDRVGAAIYRQLETAATADGVLRSLRAELTADPAARGIEDHAVAHRIAVGEAESIGARLVELAAPFEAGEARETGSDLKLERFLSELDSAGLIFVEGSKSIALAVPRAAKAIDVSSVPRLQAVAG
jgi:ribosomal peptide maturation radical SAM protein 1